MKKIFAVGDIHGCFEKLLSLMEQIDIDFDKDTLIFLGDYIDRGPQSFEVLEYLINLKNNHEHIIFLKGNHEEMFLNYLSGSDRLVFLANGGQQTLESYMNRDVRTDAGLIPSDHIDFLDSLRLYYETDEYIFVHAGLREKVPLNNQDPEDLLWIRNSFIESDYDFEKRIIFGHTPLPEPLVQNNKIGVDTGAVYGKKITCVELPQLKFYSS